MAGTRGLPLPLTKGMANRASSPNSHYTAGGLLTQSVLLSTYLAKLHVYRDKEPPTGQQHQKEWPVRERVLGMLDSGQHWREEEPVMQETAGVAQGG